MRFLVDFVAELRAAGIPVSMVEASDAAEALGHVDVMQRQQVRDTLAAALIKSGRHLDAFDVAFDAYFATEPPATIVTGTAREGRAAGDAGEGGGGAGGLGEELMDALAQAIGSGDEATIQAIVRASVARFSGMVPGRPVGGAYYGYRVLRALDVGELRRRLVAEGEHPGEAPLDRRLRLDAIERAIVRLRDLVRAEVTRRLVADRGRLPVARTMRRPLAEDVDLATATGDDLKRLETAVRPLARKLAARIARRRRVGAKGRLDVRRTVRRSLSAGGAFVEPRFRRPRPGRPDIVLVTDVSGSVTTFARFTMQLVHAISSQLSRVRSFAFIDAIDEVTAHFAPGVDVAEAMARVATEARVVWLDGHSNYGNALQQFVDEYLDAVSPTTTVIITGDARTNYHDPRADALAAIGARARAVFWLNPEHHRYWDTGDSVIGIYAAHCDEVVEVRNLRQLEAFVERVALPDEGIPPRR